MIRFVLAALLFAAFSAQAATYNLSIAVNYAAGPDVPTGLTDSGKVNVWARDNSVTPSVIIGSVAKFDKAATFQLNAVPLDNGKSYSVCVERLMPDNVTSAQPSGPLCTQFTIANAKVQIITNTSGVTVTPSATQP